MQLLFSLSPKAVRCRKLIFASILAVKCFLTASCENYSAPESSFKVAARGVEAGAFSPSGELAIIGSLHHGGSLWRVADAERLYNWNHREGEQSTLTGATFTPDGSMAATGSGDTVVIWNTVTGAAERFWTTPGSVRALALDTGPTKALAGLVGNEAVVFSALAGGGVARLSHGGPVVSAALSKDGHFALTGSADQYARWWDVAKGSVINRIPHRDEVQLVALSPDGRLALSVSKYDSARLWQVESGDVIGELSLSAERLKRGLSITAASINQDNSLLLTGRQDGVVQLWQLPDFTLVEQWRLPKRDGWQPVTPRVIALTFTQSETSAPEILAIASNGYVHRLRLAADH